MALQIRRDTAANWTSADPTLSAGEPALETDTRKEKIGDGSTAWTSLAYSPSNKQGTSTAYFKVGGRMASLPNVTPVGNVGAGEDDLMTYTIPANTFAANGDTVEFEALFVISDNDATGRVVRFYLGATDLTSYDGTNASWIEIAADFAVHARVKMVRLDSDSLLITVQMASRHGSEELGATPTFFTQVDSLTFSGTLAFKATGESGGASNNDIIQKYLDGYYTPAN